MAQRMVVTEHHLPGLLAMRSQQYCISEFSQSERREADAHGKPKAPN